MNWGVSPSTCANARSVYHPIHTVQSGEKEPLIGALSVIAVPLAPNPHSTKRPAMEEAEKEHLIGALSVIAVPLAEKKLVKKLHKLVKKAAASKLLRRGVKEVVKVLRKADKFKGCVAPAMPAALGGGGLLQRPCAHFCLQPWRSYPCYH